MVQVYPSFDAAQTGRLQAESHEQTLSGGSPDANGTGPHLVDGYGPSVWSGNAALVQTTQSELNREYRAQIERDSDLYEDPAIQDLTPTNLAVDLDFLRALQSGAVNL